MNDVKLLGRLTKDPELKQSDKGRSYVWFTVAVPRQNNRDEADFVRCIVFDKLAAAVHKYCGKGRQLLVNGRLQVSAREDQQTKEKRYYHTVIANHIEFLHEPNQGTTVAPEQADMPF